MVMVSSSDGALHDDPKLSAIDRDALTCESFMPAFREKQNKNG